MNTRKRKLETKTKSIIIKLRYEKRINDNCILFEMLTMINDLWLIKFPSYMIDDRRYVALQWWLTRRIVATINAVLLLLELIVIGLIILMVVNWILVTRPLQQMAPEQGRSIFSFDVKIQNGENIYLLFGECRKSSSWYSSVGNPGYIVIDLCLDACLKKQMKNNKFKMFFKKLYQNYFGNYIANLYDEMSLRLFKKYIFFIKYVYIVELYNYFYELSDENLNITNNLNITMSEIKNSMSLCEQMFSDDFRKLQDSLNHSKLEIINLEGQLVIERELNAINESKYQRSLQDLEHYKIKKVVENNFCEIKDDDQMYMDFKTIFNNNEIIIKRNCELSFKIDEIERYMKESTSNCNDLETLLEDSRERNNNLIELNKELKTIVNEKKEDLMKLNVLNVRINELESVNISDTGYSLISLNVNKIKDLELKCFNLEKQNEKLKVNHSNLRLLGDEKASLIGENERLKESLNEYVNNNSSKVLDRRFESNSDISIERHSKHIERENKILKYEQAQFSEQSPELKLKIAVLERNIELLKGKKGDYQILLHEKVQCIIAKDKSYDVY